MVQPSRVSFFFLASVICSSHVYLLLIRRDQLWTNDGAYRPPRPGDESLPDLADYPEYGEGWMNEEGVRIDMEHRLIPKAPLRSALKSSVNKP